MSDPMETTSTPRRPVGRRLEEDETGDERRRFFSHLVADKPLKTNESGKEIETFGRKLKGLEGRLEAFRRIWKPSEAFGRALKPFRRQTLLPSTGIMR
jgi:hypothetical protein